MNWRKTVFMLGAVLLCTSLLMANTPPAQLTAADAQLKPAAPLVKVSSAQLTPHMVPLQPAKKPQLAPPKTRLATVQPTTGAVAPQNPLRGVTCPEDSLFGQNPHGPGDAWSFATSAISTSFDYLVQESYSGVSGEICDIHWWGLSLHWTGSGWTACDPEGVTFNITFYADSGGMPGDVVCTYTGVTPAATGTGVLYSGYEMYYFEIMSLDPCCMLTDGWVSIQSQMNDNDCAFLWASSPDGDGQSLQNGAPYYYDDAFCLTGEYIPMYGACCDDYTGTCEDNVEYLDCDGRFAADTLCADLQPPCGPTGACCSMDLVCMFTSVEAECDAADGRWYEGEDCDAGFECPATCEHSIVLWDDYGDGWNGGMLDVFVSGELVLDDITLATGYGPETFTFEAATGDTITTLYTPGSWAYENYYYIYDVNGTEICADGLAGTQPVGCTCTGYCGAPQLGACCVGGECIGTMPEADCQLGGWPDAWYEGEDCFGDPPFECPGNPCDDAIYDNGAQDLVNGLACERGGTITPDVWVVDDVFFVADVNITDLHWYAATEAAYGWDGTDDIIILLPDGPNGAPGTVMYELFDVPNTRQYVCDSFGRPVYFYSLDGINLFLPAGGYWIGMRPVGTTGTGRSFWQTSPDNGTADVYFRAEYWGYIDWTPGVEVFGTPYNVAFCITGYYGEPPVGACCDDATGICEDNVEFTDCLEPGMRFVEDTLCADLQPPCGQYTGACCCPDGSCEITFQMDCVAPCMWLGADTTCDECPPLGACCVEDEYGEYQCVATCWEVECDGRWYEGEDCFGDPPFECPQTDADFIVYAPYTSPTRNTCGEGNDCALRAYEEHEYEVIIPYESVWNFNTCLDTSWDTYIFLGTTLCSQDIGYNDDSCGAQSEIIVNLGPGNYFCTIEGYSTCGQYIFDVTDAGLGACCVYNEEILCYDVHEFECDEMGGTFYLGESCDTFECPVPCEESQIDIVILTDTYPSETTWEVTDFYTGELLCSGGPYSGSNTYYFEMCCIGYEDCADFTIYDSYGDGIYAPGGYTVSVDGEVICDAMGGGFTGSVQVCPMLGGGCVWPEGACCVYNPDTEEFECVATNTEPECDDLGGRFYVGEDCFGDPPFECPQCFVDFCVTAPYTSEILNTCGAGDDCALRTGEEHEWMVTIPHEGLWSFNTCLLAELDTYIFLGTDQCTQDLGYNDDACGLQSEIIIFLGPGNYFLTMEAYSGCGNYIFDVHEIESCEVICPENGFIEGEPVCGDNYVDDYNGGCNSSPYVFQDITCDEIICGESGTFYFNGLSYRDTDWFRVVIEEDTTLGWSVCAEFDILIFIIDGGSENCVDYTILGSMTGAAYTETSLSFAVGPGVYWLWAGPSVFSGVPCGSEYIGTVSGVAACICGDFDNDDDVDADDYYFFLDAFGSCEGDLKYEEACDFDGDGCITLVDYQMWMQCYRDANGKAFVVPNPRLNSRPGGQQAPRGALRH